VLSDPKVIRLFELLEKNRAGLEPVFAPRRDSWVSYPLIERELGADSDYSVQLLEDLTRLGYLTRKFWDNRLSQVPVGPHGASARARTPELRLHRR